MLQTIRCTFQNRLGAMDRVIAAFTLRGLVPEHLEIKSNLEDGLMHFKITFECSDDRILDKLIKALKKQVYVLTVSIVDETQSTAAKDTHLASPITNLSNTLYASQHTTIQKEPLHA